MADDTKLREAVEQAVSSALDAHRMALKSDIVGRVCSELGAYLQTPAPSTPPGGESTGVLNAAFASILDCASQADILAALLAGAARFSGRVALFVFRGNSAVGWRAAGFDDDEAVKSQNIDITSGLVARAVQDRLPVAAAAVEFDPDFMARFGAPAEGANVLVLPLVLREKVAAIVYADAGHAGQFDTSALECLVRATGLWLEVVSIRKIQPVEPGETIPAKGPLAQTSAPVPAAEVTMATPPPVAPPAAVAMAAAAPAPVAPAVPGVSLTVDDEEIHKKAKRFAKLLVDEIKLYNQAKVKDGRAHKDLYERLRDDIDKSRASYDRRYGQTCAAANNYFTQELVRILCDGDESLLGEAFSR
jgi:hypothetical protein